MRVSAFTWPGWRHLTVVPPVRGAGRAGPVQVERLPDERPGQGRPGLLGLSRDDGEVTGRPSTPAPCGGIGLVPPVTEPEDPAGGIIFYRPGGGARSPAPGQQEPGDQAGDHGVTGRLARQQIHHGQRQHTVSRARKSRRRGRPCQMRAGISAAPPAGPDKLPRP